MEKAHNKPDILKKLAISCNSATIFIAVLGLIGWTFGISTLIRVRDGFIPIGILTCVAFVIQGMLLVWHLKSPSSLRGFPVILCCLVTFLIGMSGLFSGSNIDRNPILNFPPLAMSPLTGLFFISTGIGILLICYRSTSKITSIYVDVNAAIIITAGLVITLSYLYAEPLLYEFPIIPIALPTSIGFIFLGVGLKASTGSEKFLSVWTSNSIKAMLLRTFVPLVFIGIILSNILLHQITRLNSAIVSGASVLVFGVITVIIVVHSARIIGRIVERAEVERKRAEEKLIESEERYRFLFMGSSTVVLLIDPETGALVDANPKAVAFYGSIEKAVDSGLIKDGIMRAIVDNSIPYVLAGSIRDDGPLPGVISDNYEAQDKMRALARKTTTVIAMATQLHSIATGNMIPSYRVNSDGNIRPVYFFTVDMSEFAANKLANRGSLTARSILTNTQDFVVNLHRKLNRRRADV